MIRQLAKKLAQAIAPLVLRELVYLLEDLLKTDINQDGQIGNNEN